MSRYRRKNWHRGYTKRHLRKKRFRKPKIRIKTGTIIKFLILLVVIYLIFNNWNDIVSWFKDFDSSDVSEYFDDMIPKNNWDLDKIELLIYEKTNEERIQNSIFPLDYSEELSDLARLHSEDMMTQNFFAHVNPDGEDPTDRARRMGLSTTKNLEGGWIQMGIGENIGGTYLNVEVIGCGHIGNEEDVAECLVSSWMGSYGHRENILDTSYDLIGIGIACDDYECVATQDFF